MANILDSAPSPVSLPLAVPLFDKVLAAGRWVLVGVVTTQIIRFGTNLALARLLFPEAFGLMALVMALAIGVTLVLDVGTQAAVVVNRMGDQQEYLDSAWTLQLLRAIAVAAVVSVCAWPIASHYGQRELLPLALLVALSTLINGFASTKLALAARSLAARRVVIIDLPVQLAGVAASVVLAWWWRDAMALACGGIVSALVNVAASQWGLPGPLTRWRWRREELLPLLRFSLMIVPGSIATFMLFEGSKLLSGSLLDLHTFSMLAMSLSLIAMATQVWDALAGRVLFPAYAEIHRAGDASRFTAAVARARRPQLLFVGSVALLLACGGHWLFALLYDARYRAGGPILELLALGMLGTCLSTSYAGVQIARQRLRAEVVWTIARAALTWLCIAGGYLLGGSLGVVVGFAVAGWVCYPVTVLVFRPQGLWFPLIDAAAAVVALAVVLVSYRVGQWPLLLQQMAG